MDWEAVAAIAAIVGLLGALLGWVLSEYRASKTWKLELQRFKNEELVREKDELRRNEVHAWTDRGIETLITLSISTRYPELVDEADIGERMIELSFASSVLVEQGRLFFKNKPHGDFGKEKPSAFQGLRPKILDELVLAHQIALRWRGSDAIAKRKLSYLAHGALQRFVSLAQLEVGRQRAASDYAAAGGFGINIDRLLSGTALEQVEYWERAHIIQGAQARWHSAN
jgi:hypothetical protein